jgi:hypothetical protein
MQADRDTFASNEILSHQQSLGISYGLKKVTGKLNGLLSSGTYKLFLASLLRKDFVVGVATTATSTIACAPTIGFQGTLTATVINWLTLGFKVGDVVSNTGWLTTGAALNNRNALVIALTSTVMTIAMLDNAVVPTKIAGDPVTVTVVGKKSLAPMTSQTNDYYTIEDQYIDLGKYEYFTDMRVSKCAISLPTSGNATIAFDFMGLNRLIGSAAILTSPTVESTTPIMTSVQGAAFVGSSIMANCTGATLNIDAGMTGAVPILGSNYGIDIPRGVTKVSGTVTGVFSDTVTQSFFDTETPTGLVIVITSDQTGSAALMAFSLSRIKFTGDVPDDGEKVISRTYPFTAEINNNGGTSLASDQTILTIQDSAA